MYAPTPPLPITPATRRILLLGTSLGVAALVALSVRTAPPAPDGLPGAGPAPPGGMLPAVVVPGAGAARFESHTAGGTIVFAPDGVTLRRPAGDLTSAS